jgi:mannose/fructose/N-acetylgalactosamine-specific phosphotransferase system component IID
MDGSMRRRVFFRSFFLQAFWSFERMQNLGFLFAIDPWLDRIYADPQRRKEASLRHLEYFNTQPYMASYLLGLVGGLEEKLSRSGAGDRPALEAGISDAKKMLSPALAAVGDRLFWGSLRPSCAAVSMLATLALWTASFPFPVFLGCLAFLILFNAPAIWLRWRGLEAGLQGRESVVADMEIIRPGLMGLWARRAGFFAACAGTVAAMVVPPAGGGASFWNLAVLSGCLFLKKKGVSALRIFSGLVAAGVILEALRP